jgi:hypothetical protein
VPAAVEAHTVGGEGDVVDCGSQVALLGEDAASGLLQLGSTTAMPIVSK